MIKKILRIFLILLFLLSLAIFWNQILHPKIKNLIGLRKCPERKVVNGMPMSINSIDDLVNAKPVYFIYQGVRHELDEFNQDWVEVNCNVKTDEVI